ncbi:uncharacterized protein LOC134202123 [Armigeres subalbatus]|uniref:uncharacterized protein LOC134202123 n=1 Tax=Armigeres subalbatus TaxID=124917 RepID=UPI002ED180E2
MENGSHESILNESIVQNKVSFFNPAAYNLPQFKYKHLPQSEIRHAWSSWIRWFETIMAAAHITDGHGRKMQLLAMGDLELQSAYYGIPGCAEDDADPLTDPYVSIKEKLTQYFSPKHHDTFERFLFWSMVPDDHEPIEKFAQRVQQKAEKCSFGKSEIESRQIAIMDKIIQYATDDLRQKLLEKEQLALDEALKTINAYQSVRYQASKMNTKQGSAFHQHEMVNRLYQNSKKPLIPDSKPRCLRCGYIRHREAEQCPALGKTCLRCNKPGHFQSVCKTKSYTVNSGNFDRKRKAVISNNQGPSRPAKFRPVFNIDEQREETKREDHAVYNVGGSDEVITCNVGGVDIKMLIDSGSKHNLIDDTTWQLMKLRDVKSFNERFDHEKRFLAYGRVPLKLVTVFDADLEVEDGDRRLKTTATFYVIGKGQQPLLGKTTAQKIGVLKVGLPSTQYSSIHRIEMSKEPFPKMKGIKLTLPIDRTIPPVIQPLRRCPIPLLQQVESKLDELLRLDIIEKVMRPTSWVSPLVPILKDNGELRLCVDMRRANQAIHRLNHPLPIFDDLLPKFRNAKFFTTLDIKQAFHQVELTEDCRDITTFITNWGLFRYKRLLFGVNCAPELFQNLMESILAECPNTVVFIDDIMTFGSTEEEHDAEVKKTLNTLKRYGILLNDHKCKFKQTQTAFLGHILTSEGIAPAEEKVKSILQFRSPQTKEELRSFLGLVTYVSRFIPNLATVNHPLRELLKQESSFDWKSVHQEAFDQLKKMIGSVDNLGYYDPNDRTLLITDASGVGLGAVLLQFKENRPRVISYASKSLSETKKSIRR